MKIIGAFGRKGGTGKSMVSHLAAHGISRGFGNWTTLLKTDVRTKDPVNLSPNRDYMVATADNSSPASAAEGVLKVLRHTAAIPDSCLIIDGGANRRLVDLKLAELCDMVLIPTGYSVEDIEVAEADYWELKEYLATKGRGEKTKVFMVRNRWPGSQQRMKLVQSKPWVQSFLLRASHSGAIFPDYIPDMPSFLDMAHEKDPKTTPLIDSLAVGFGQIVAETAKLNLGERRSLARTHVANKREAA